MATLDLIESLGELRRRMSCLSFPRDYDDYMSTEREIIGLLSRLSTAKLDEASISALRLELPEVFTLGSGFRGFVLDLLPRLGPPDEAFQELFRRILDARGERTSPYSMHTGEYLQLVKLLKDVASPMPTLVVPVRNVFETDLDDGPVSVQETEMQLRAAGLLVEWDSPEGVGVAMDDRCDAPSFRKRVVELMKAGEEWRMHSISDPEVLQLLYSRLSEVSGAFGRLVDRYHERIRNGEKVLTCPNCGEYGVFASYRGIPTETIRERVRCEQCGTELVLEITEAVQAPGHEEHARARFAIRSTE